MNISTRKRLGMALLLVDTSRERVRDAAARLELDTHPTAGELRVTTHLLSDALQILEDLNERALL